MVRYARSVANSYARRKRRRNGAYRLERNYIEYTHAGATQGYGHAEGSSTTHAATQLTVVPQYVNLNTEAGQLDTPAGLCNIERGTSVNTRVGRRVWVDSLQVVGVFQYDVTNTQQSSIVFNLALCCYKDCDKRAPNVQDIFESEFPPMRKIQHQADYQVIKNWRKTLKVDWEYTSADPQVTHGYAEAPFTMYKKMNKMIEFTPGSDAPIKSSDIERNNMFFVAWVSSNNGVANMDFKVRMKYIDM